MLDNQNKEIENTAVAFARSYKKSIARSIVDSVARDEEAEPWSVFMAGAPGAGKSEISKAFESIANTALPPSSPEPGHVLRIDPDDFRERLPGYRGGNSSLFNRAVSLITESVLDRAFKRRASFILDGTFSSESVAHKNITRALQKGYDITIVYVYQQPLQAWDFVQSRELVEGRKIPLRDFVDKHFAARKTVKAMKNHYGNCINIDLIIQTDRKTECRPLSVQNIPAELIDLLIQEPYSETQLIKIIATRAMQ